MKVLVFILAISNLCLVHSDDKPAIDTSTYKVHPDPEDVQNDQIAESSHPVRHGLVINHQKEIPEGSQTRIQVPDLRHEGQNVAQQGVAQEGLRHNSEVAQQDLSHIYAHPIYVQQYPVQPVRILGAEASPLQHVREGHNSFGFSSYVEHVSKKDEEDIQSALKEGSVSDIKRLVPKSGISFKIYHNDKNANLNLENHKTEIHSSNALTSGIPEYSGLHYKAEVPATQLKIQTVEHHQPTVVGLEELHHSYVKPNVGEQQHVLDNSQHLLQVVGKTDQQSANGQTLYFTHSGGESQKTLLEVNEKASAQVNPNYKANLESKATSTAEFNSLSTTTKGYGHGLGDYGHSHYQRLESKSENAQQSGRNVKSFAASQYEIDPLAQAERSKGLHYTQNQATSYVVHGNYNKHKSGGETAKNANYVSYVTKTSPGLQANKVYDRKVAPGNRLPGNYVGSESVKTGQNHIISHLGTSAYGNSQHFKGSQSDHYATNSYSDSEAVKSGQQNFIGHVAKNAYVESKNSQNFDHQKALEGSTSFDIKNAIDSSGNLIHQTSYATPPTTDVHHLEGIQKQQLAYIIPKIPASTVLLDNAIHETPILEGHQIKEFGHAGISSPQFSYHVSSPDVSGKFFHQPQTIIWTPEHLKQGNPNDLHQSIIRVNLPREEIYQHVKAQNVELPTSTIAHISYPGHKQPYVLHYDPPLVKYPQEIHFQQKTKTGIQTNQANHLKLTQPVTVDWSLFKNAMPNFNLNSLALKPELAHIQETGKKIVPILVRKRKNRSNNKQEVGVIYGKVNNNRRPSKPNHRQEKNVRVNLLPEASNTVQQFEGKGERKNEFSVSASYKVDRSFKNPNSS